MKIAVGSDHRGFHLKSKLIPLLQELGHDVEDVGTSSAESVDYTDFGAVVAHKVSCGDIDRGILICGTGIGMAITANKFPGVRAITCPDELTAEMCRRHNDVNILCLSADMLGERPIDRMIEVWLTTEFEGGRHARRVDKIRDIEKQHLTESERGCPPSSC
ncbi:MAG: ribose 5-phosphate isomerase B [Planctomycetales bacterium]|nr:ribose 5-phosphate isomerase B [Planctomycetales bacterium]